MEKTIRSDLEIAQSATLQPIKSIAASIGLSEDDYDPYGKYKAKLSDGLKDRLKTRADGKLVLVTAINPTPAGEGKSTVTVGLGQALHRAGRKTMICLREPSLGPTMGLKGGACGGGYSQVLPMEDINLHFTGDMHAITTAHNTISALLDNHLHQGNRLGIDPRRITWKRVLDLNDRSLRHVTIGLGGPAHSVPRQDGFDITVASEIMAVLCLADSLEDLEARISRIVVAETYAKTKVTVADLQAAGAATLLLKEAFRPNLVQTLEGTPALIHGGPFANIAHGCNSLVATRTALKLSDIVVTEAGFGADLGAEKFFNIKSRQGLHPDAVVVVATVRALNEQGGIPKNALEEGKLTALTSGPPLSQNGLAARAERVQNFNRRAPDLLLRMCNLHVEGSGLSVGIGVNRAQGLLGESILARAENCAITLDHVAARLPFCYPRSVLTQARNLEGEVVLTAGHRDLLCAPDEFTLVKSGVRQLTPRRSSDQLASVYYR